MFADLSAKFHKFVLAPEEAYRDVLVVALIATAAIMFLHLIVAFIGGRPKKRHHPWNLWEKLIYLVTLISVAVLGVTAFYSVLRFGSLEGWWLYAHMFGAGALVAVLPLLAVTWCVPNRFGTSGPAGPSDAFAARFYWVPKVLYWLLLAGGLTVTLTMLLSMVPLYGTDVLLRLLDLHRYAGLLVVVVTALHLYCVLLQRTHLR